MQSTNVKPTHALQPLANQVLAYCDGACRGNGVAAQAKGGFGTVIVLPSGEQIDIYGGESATTNNRMELLGAIAALEHSPTDLPIQIWSDSNYVIRGITEWLGGWQRKNWKNVKNVDLWQRLDQATRHRQIDWQWVKGHAGHAGNEYADKLANRGIDHLPTPFAKQLLPANSTGSAETAKKKSQTSTSTVTKMTSPMPNQPTLSPENNTNLGMVNPSMGEAYAAHDPNHLGGEYAASFDYLETNSFQDNGFQSSGFQGDSYQGDSYQGDSDMADSGDFLLAVLDDPNERGFLQTHQKNQPMPPIQAVATAAVSAPGQGQSLFAGFIDAQGNFIAQDAQLIAKRPQFDGVTSQPNTSFVPLLPIAKHQGTANRQLILDTETTGFEAQNGDRIIEVGIVELINRRFTGEKLHVYINPHKQMGEEVIKVHGIHNVFLDGMPSFGQIGHALYAFLQGAELIAHNANFDMSFLQAEFGRLGLPDIMQHVTVTDSLAMAKQRYAGQRNTLDALVKRLDVGKQDRTFHGALLDAEILAEVYLAMTGGQVTLAIDDVAGGSGANGLSEHQRFYVNVPRVHASAQDEQAHLAWVQALAGKHPQLAENWGIATQ